MTRRASPSRPHLCALLALTVLAGCAATPGPGGRSASPEPRTDNKLAEVQTRLGISYLREGRLELAYNRLSKALRADPDYSTAHNAMGTLQERLGDLESAERHFRTAVTLDPTDSSAQSNYGSFLCRTGRPAEGEQRLLQALKNSLYERPEVAYNNAGICMLGAGDTVKAEAYFRSALERNPRIPAALQGMARLSFDAGRHLPARAYLQRYEELAELDAADLWLAVRIERALGDEAVAQRYATELRERFPDARETVLLEGTAQ